MSNGHHQNRDRHRHQGGNPRRGNQEERPLNEDLIRKWVQEGINATNGDELIKFARDEANLMKRDLTKTQFRNVFNELRRIQQLFEGDANREAIRAILKLQPKLAYLSKRIGKKGATRFKDLLTKAIECHEQQYAERFENFMDMAEALMGYHYAVATAE